MFCQHKPGMKVEKLMFLNIWHSAPLSESHFRSLFSLEILNREFQFPDLFQWSLQKSLAVLKIWGKQQLLRHLIVFQQRTVTEPERTSLKNHTTHITKTLIVHMEVIRWDPSQTMQLLRKNPIQHNTVVRYGNWCTIETSIVTNGLIHCVERVEKREEQIQKIF